MSSDRLKVLTTGLSVIYAPAEDEPLADIVFVHGLRGHPVSTWTGTTPDPEAESVRSPSPSGAEAQKRKNKLFSRSKKPAPASEVFWPQEFLPSDCPKARILTWGYDTNIVKNYGPVDQNNIFAHARNLLAALERHRRVGQPVMFVAHSLGGIIVKEVLRRSADSEEASFKDIVQCTASIIFLSTPHRGSAGFAGLADMVRRVAGFALRMDSNDKILTALVGGSELELGRESFPKLWRQHEFAVKTFQEARAMSGVNVGLANERVVPPESSSLDDPRENAESIDANHITMCKFGSRDENGYQQVSGELKKRMNGIVNRIQAELNEVGNACLRSLAFEGMKTRQHNIEAVMEGTCSWLDTNQQYCQWTSRSNIQQHQGLLWIKGKPGSGKSTLMKVTAERLKNSTLNAKRIVVAHFFHGRGVGLQKLPLGLFRSLLHQILPEHQPMLNALVQIYLRKVQTEGTEGTMWEWTQEELMIFLRSHLLARSEYRFDIFIDALDECSEEEARVVVKYFEDLSSSALAVGANLNICIASRHYPNISVAKCNEIIVEDENEEDIYQYIIRTLSVKKNPNDRSVESLAGKIQQKSAGIFLWTVFAVRTVNADQDKALPLDHTLEKLEKLPTKLDEIFTQLFRELDPDNVNEAVTIFQFLLLAQRPFTFLELRHAIAFSGKSTISSLRQWKDQEGTQIANYERFMKRVLDVSKGLVEIIVDVTVPVKYEDSPQPDQAPGEIINDLGQEDTLQNEVDEQNSSPGDEQHSVVTKNDASNKLLVAPGVTSNTGIEISIGGGPPVYMEWSWDSFSQVLPTIVSQLMNPQPLRPAQVVIPLHIWDSRHPWGFDLDLKAVAGMQVQFIHETVRSFFLEKGFQLLDPSLGTQALARGHRLLSKSCYSYLSTEEIRTLPEMASSDDWYFGRLNSPLSQLATKFSLEASQLSLVWYGFEYFLHHARQAELEGLPLDFIKRNDPTITTEMIRMWRKSTSLANNSTILSFLCNEGLFHSAEALIDENLDLRDIETLEDKTLLHGTVKCKEGKCTDEAIAGMVKILLDHGADPEAVTEDWDKVTPLHIAAERNLSATVACLLEGGANPNAKDPWKRSPLYKAISEHERKIFLSRENDPGSVDFSKTYNALLSHGADIIEDGEFAHAITQLPFNEVRRFFNSLEPEQLSRWQAQNILHDAVLRDKFDCCLMLLNSAAFCSKLYVESYDDVKPLTDVYTTNNSSSPQTSQRTKKGESRSQKLREVAALLDQRRQEAVLAGRTDKEHWLVSQEVWLPVTASVSAAMIAYRWLSWGNDMPSSMYKTAGIVSAVIFAEGVLYIFASKSSLTVFVLSSMVWGLQMAYLLLVELPRFLCDSIWFRLWWLSAVLSMYVANAKLSLFAARLWISVLLVTTAVWVLRHWTVD